MLPNEEVWFYMKERQQLGPVGMFELKKLFEQGVLNQDTYLWNKSAENWQIARNLEPFKHFKEKYPLEAPQANGSVPEENPEKASFTKGRPIVRFIARMFDLSIFTAFFLTFVSIFSPRMIMTTSKLLLFILNVLLWLFIEPLIVSIFGNTLGKGLLHTKMKSVTGDCIDFITAFKRSIFVFIAGMGFGVPFVSFICNLFSYKDLKVHGISAWDKKNNTVILYGDVNRSRIFLMACFPVALLLAGLII